MGDPAGIGPEVTVAALARSMPRADVVLVGDPEVWREAVERAGAPLELRDYAPGASRRRRSISLFAAAKLRPRERVPAKPSRAGGRAAYASIVAAVELIRSGAADALVTAPINKANLAAAGCCATGHTELLAELCGGAEVRMMMVGPRLRVALVTTHLAIADLPAAIERGGVRRTIEIADRALRQHFAIAAPRIAVTGLNPHAGESGLYGREEIDVVGPAVRQARRKGIDVTGPIAADTAFPIAAGGAFDVVVCMYHDQALAPFKLLHFDDGVNFTAGLPFVRTSPDHGTAYDIAGRAIARADSMIAAIETAARCAGAAPGRRGAAVGTLHSTGEKRK